MNVIPRKSAFDYRINQNEKGQVVSIEVHCCGNHIGEMHFRDEEEVTCPNCGVSHRLYVEHRHFHLQPVPPEKDS